MPKAPAKSLPVSSTPKVAPAAARKNQVEKSGVTIVGSLNMDLVVKMETMPAPGQTVLGQNLQQVPGGKGANQAAAAAKLLSRAPCRMIGRVGDDSFAERLLTSLKDNKVDTTTILNTKNIPSGAALILIDRHGENAIVVAGGANQLLDSADLLAQRKAIAAARVMTVQLESPFDTVACAIALARQSGTLAILDPAPAPPEGLPESLFHVDILSPNQSETEILTGVTVRTLDDARRAGERLLHRGTHTAVLKLGSQGAMIVARKPDNSIYSLHIPGFRVDVVDTTAAGDCFTGALAAALAEEMPLPDAVRFANAAGALACTKFGAQSSIPSRDDVEALLKRGTTKPHPKRKIAEKITK